MESDWGSHIVGLHEDGSDTYFPMYKHDQESELTSNMSSCVRSYVEVLLLQNVTLPHACPASRMPRLGQSSAFVWPNLHLPTRGTNKPQ